MSVRNCSEFGPYVREITRKYLRDQTLCKLLYYQDKDPLAQADIADTNILFKKQIKFIPKYNPAEDSSSVISTVIYNGDVDNKNNEIINCRIKVFIWVPLDNWEIKNDNLRPFAIMGEVQKIFEEQISLPIGKPKYLGFNIEAVTEDMSCYQMDFICGAFT